MDLFTCPAPTALAATPDITCPVRIGQIQKIGFRRITGKTALTPTNILLLATFTPLLSAADGTKLLISPYLNDVIIPQTAELEQGGNDNTTLNGIPELRGIGVVKCTAKLYNVPSSTAAALRALASESALAPGFTNLEALLYNKNGLVVVDKPTSAAVVQGFKVYNFVVSDVGSAGFLSNNIFNISWYFEGLWSNGFQIYTPTDYNPLTLVNS